MEKNLYKVLGISHKKLAKYNSIEEVEKFDVVSPGIEHEADAINFRKRMFEEYPDFYFTIRKGTIDDCFITVNQKQLDNVINYNRVEQ